jgi:hypothetical protein
MAPQAFDRHVKVGAIDGSERIESDIVHECQGNVVVYDDRFPGALRNAGSAIDALLGIDEQLSWEMRRAVRRSMLDDASHRADVHARAIHAISAKARDDVSHR